MVPFLSASTYGLMGYAGFLTVSGGEALGNDSELSEAAEVTTGLHYERKKQSCHRGEALGNDSELSEAAEVTTGLHYERKKQSCHRCCPTYPKVRSVNNEKEDPGIDTTLLSKALAKKLNSP
ncbi:hypothetical protein HGM15179_010127 [Zosterops borbonicus]|uniref:Uncharacterized protein n=1 Tax=Zosterops borbonicus TaxID=364589 RepID=A0A8K1GF94_9PASS|nr:hypothetical protein HGM15179_010127 [Zosterops borbonicus]